MKINCTPPIVPTILIEQHHVGMPPIETPHAKVVKATQDTIFSALPNLQILPALTIIDNIPGGVDREIEKVEEKEHAKKADEKEEEKKEEEEKVEER